MTTETQTFDQTEIYLLWEAVGDQLKHLRTRILALEKEPFTDQTAVEAHRHCQNRQAAYEQLYKKLRRL